LTTNTTTLIVKKNELMHGEWKYKHPRSFPHALLITGFVTRLTRRMPLVEQQRPTLPEHLSPPPF
jgi:hypothetical protein